MTPSRKTLRIFVSFEFDKDIELKKNFYGQAKRETTHRVRNFSLNEAYPDAEWVGKARSKIEECDVVIVLVGPDTHNAPGVETEVRLARGMGKPVFQVVRRDWSYQGVPYLKQPIPWRWKLINEKLDAIRG